MNYVMHSRYTSIRYAVAGLLLAAIVYYFLFPHNSKPPPVPDDLPKYTAATLITYNGDMDGLPIYVALDGYVYDVTAGKSYYAPGGTYHSIAGKDASAQLHVFGGDIIRQKYPIVGILMPSQ